MKVIVYNTILDSTSVMLNFCISNKKWKYAYKLITLRKKYAGKLRDLVKRSQNTHQ